MKRTRRLATLGSILLICLAVLTVAPARAQDQDEEKTDTGVARISLIRGDAFMTRGDSGDQVEAKINVPLVRGDKITTGDRSQVEIQLDHSNIIRLAPRSEVRIADLTRSQIQLQVAQGLVNYTVFKSNEAQIELDTPNMAVRPVKEGSYRIQVTSPTETQLIVRKGDADVTTPEGTTGVEEGRMITVRGADNPEYQLAKAPGRDDWDKWNTDRDKAVDNANSYKYANRYYTGAQDLDRNGRWAYIPEYGDYAWTPYVGAGWSPYYDGYWGWQPYWGWTWISYEPWGWAPYHYGRWSYYGSSWYWYPGRHSYGYYPTWGPAWVSFIGFGYGGYNWGFGLGYGYSSIGWCALGPYDSYSPWWGRHNSYTSVNITNITNITNVTNINRGGRGHDQFGRGGFQSNLQTALTNSNVRGGITRVSTDDFMRGNFSRAQRGLDANTLRGGQLVQGRIPVAPTRETLRPVNGNSRTGLNSGTDRFFSRREAPAVGRTFNEQAASVQNMMRNTNLSGGAGSGREAATGAAGNGFARSGAAAGGSATTGAGNRGTGAAATGFGRGREATGSSTATTPATSGVGSAGWSRFGQPGARGGQGSGQADTGIAQRRSQAQRSSGQPGQTAPAQERNWQRFGTGQPRAVPGRPTTTGTPQGTTPGSSGRSEFGNTGRTTQGERSGGAPASRVEGGYTPPQRGGSGAAASGGWRRFGARSDNSSGTGRPALDIRKPITTERAAPRSFERSQPAGGGQPSQGRAPASSPRSFEGGGQPAPRSFERGTGGSSGSQGRAPASNPRSFEGTGRAAPSSSPRNFQGGGGSAAPRSFERSAPSSSGYSGGTRGWSAPSGGTGRSAPSGGYSGGGNRSYSAPSGGYGGGSRGYSAPSGGYGGGGGRSYSAPSGGYGGGGGRGASAPSGGYGGGGRGYSAPSGGYGGGGGRGASAPSGGYGGGGGRGGSAPSGGGGHSAPSSSRGGGNSGRR